MCTWRAVNHGLCEKPRIVKSKPVIVNLKTRFRVETYDCQLIVHLASIKIEKPRLKVVSQVSQRINKKPRIVDEKPWFAD